MKTTIVDEVKSTECACCSLSVLGNGEIVGRHGSYMGDVTITRTHGGSYLLSLGGLVLLKESTHVSTNSDDAPNITFPSGELSLEFSAPTNFAVTVYWNPDDCDQMPPKKHIKPSPQTKAVEWVNGLPPVGSIVHGRFMHTSATDGEWQIDYISESVGVYTAVETGKQFTFATDNVILSKIETEAEKLERERLEAAYDLYLAFWSASKSSVILESFKEFSCSGNSDLKHFLAVVDKTGYRKD